MKKPLFLLASLLCSLSLSSLSLALDCTIPTDSPLRETMRRYAAACGAEGDSPLRFSAPCSDFNTNAVSEPDRIIYAKGCSVEVGGGTFTVCGCLTSKNCQDDPLFREFSCHGTASTPPPNDNPPPPHPESRPESMPANPEVPSPTLPTPPAPTPPVTAVSTPPGETESFLEGSGCNRIVGFQQRPFSFFTVGLAGFVTLMGLILLRGLPTFLCAFAAKIKRKGRG